ncbi:SWIM-type domain-containing protein, partial [Dysosmobacter welbionis]
GTSAPDAGASAAQASGTGRRVAGAGAEAARTDGQLPGNPRRGRAAAGGGPGDGGRLGWRGRTGLRRPLLSGAANGPGP